MVKLVQKPPPAITHAISHQQTSLCTSEQHGQRRPLPWGLIMTVKLSALSTVVTGQQLRACGATVNYKHGYAGTGCKEAGLTIMAAGLVAGACAVWAPRMRAHIYCPCSARTAPNCSVLKHGVQQSVNIPHHSRALASAAAACTADDIMGQQRQRAARPRAARRAESAAEGAGPAHGPGGGQAVWSRRGRGTTRAANGIAGGRIAVGPGKVRHATQAIQRGA